MVTQILMMISLEDQRYHGGGSGSSSSCDCDSIFSGSNRNGSAFNSYDIFGGMAALNSSSLVKNNVNNDDVFRTFTWPPKQSAQVADLLGGFGGAEAKPKSSCGNRSTNRVKNESNFDDFIPGFGGINPPNSGNTGKHPQKPINQPNKATSTLLEDPFVVLESASPLNSSDFDPLENISKLNNFEAAKPPRLKSPPKEAQVSKGHKVKSTGISSIDEIEDFVMGRGKNNAKGRSNVPSTEEGDYNSAAQVFGEFEEVEGESEERRRARLGRLQRTQERAQKAVADMNQHYLQSQQEQEERWRIAESVNIEIKCWAAGKEGNMRGLLSSLQYVLWPECGWQPVSLTDLITSTSVKNVYRKANLYVHPDKVQQKGATLQQKYTLEKVFFILKEAWTKFNAEELS